jgi:cephalosporin hydroxylase
MEITKESLLKNRFISENMEGTTFHFHTHILYDIRTSLGEGIKKYLEIGSFAGCSVSLISSHPFSTECYTIDLGTPISPDIVNRNVEKFKNKNSSHKYFQGSSSNPQIIQIVKDEVINVDLLFIDGGHLYDEVIADFNNYSDMVVSGGYICFDDYLDHKYSPQVKPAVDDLVKILDPNDYVIIGTPSYDFISEFSDLTSNNIFIIQKK